MAATIRSSSKFLLEEAAQQGRQLVVKEKSIRRALEAFQKINERHPTCRWTWEQIEQAQQQVKDIENRREEFRYHNFRTKWAVKGDRVNAEFFQAVKQKKNHTGIRKLRREDGKITYD